MTSAFWFTVWLFAFGYALGVFTVVAIYAAYIIHKTRKENHDRQRP